MYIISNITYAIYLPIMIDIGTQLIMIHKKFSQKLGSRAKT